MSKLKSCGFLIFRDTPPAETEATGSEGSNRSQLKRVRYKSTDLFSFA